MQQRPPKAPPAPAPRPAEGKGTKVMASLMPLLALMTVVSTAYLFKWKKDYGRLARERRAWMLALPHLEQARDLLDQADRYGRLPDPDFDAVRERAERAVELATDAMSKFPPEAAVLEEVHRVRGRALETQYNFAEARADYEDAVRRHPESPARFWLGLLGTRELARARLAGMKTSLLAEDELAGRAAEPLRRFQAPAVEFLTKEAALKIDEDYRTLCTACVAYAVGEYKEVGPSASAADGFDRTNWLTPYVAGLAAFELEVYPEAMRHFQEAIRRAPAVADPHAWLGRAYDRLNRRTDAIEALKTALDADKHFLEAYYVLGTILFEDARYAEARSAFHSFAQLRPSLPEAHLKLGVASLEHWRRSGRTDPEDLNIAAQAFSDYISRSPRDPQGYILRAQTMLARRDAGKAEQDLTTALGLAPAAVDALAMRAEIYEGRREWAKAEKDYEAILEKSTDPARTALAHRRRAASRARAGRLEEALKDYEDLLAKDPNDLGLLAEKGRLQFDANQFQDALATVERGLSIGASAPLRLLRAEILLEMGDAAAAVEEASKAIAADPQLAGALVVRGRAYQKQGDKAKAAADWARAIELRPDLKESLEPLIEKMTR
jgi:tetratricopeptide (TPR) repeat protein